MENQLATIEEISEIIPAINSDNLELAKIRGYQSVIKKSDNYQKGQKVVFVFTDTIVPDKPEFSFLSKDKFRVRTIRLRGNISQGIVLPLTVLPDANKVIYADRQDVSEILGIKKYEKPIPVNMQGYTKGNFPCHLCRKTDELNIQNYPEALKEFIDEEVYITTKYDGTSATYLYVGDDFEVCSRNLSIKEGDNLYWRMAKKYNLIDGLKNFKQYAIQGECCGLGLQKNPMEYPDQRFYVFNVFDIEKQKYVDFDEMMDVCEQLNLKIVEIISRRKFNSTLEDLLRDVQNYTYEFTPNPVEGWVVRTTTEQYSYVLQGRKSFKVINPNYKD